MPKHCCRQATLRDPKALQVFPTTFNTTPSHPVDKLRKQHNICTHIFIYLFLKFSAIYNYSRAFRPLGILKSTATAIQSSILPSKDAQDGSCLIHLRGTHSWEHLSSAPHHRKSGKTIIQYFGHTGPSLLAGVKFNTCGRDHSSLTQF